VHGLEFGPNGLHILDGGGGGVAQFAAEHDEGFALDDELGDVALLAEAGHGVLRKSELGYCAKQQ